MSKNILHNFWNDRSGNILMLTGLGFLFLVGIGGAGYDLGRQQLVRQKVQQAADSAALAAAGMEPGTSSAQRQGTATAFFNLNYPQSYLGVDRPNAVITIGEKTVNVAVGGNAAPVSIRTSFVSNFGIATLPIVGSSTVNIRSEYNTVDLILVMDNSGSMKFKDVGGSEASNAVTANVIDSCAWAFGEANRSWCASPVFLDSNERGLTGASRLNALRGAALTAAGKLLDPNPNANRVAVVTWDSKVLNQVDFSTEYNWVRTLITGMFAYGDTNSYTGLYAADHFSAGFRSNAVHAIVLLTDGENTTPSKSVANSQSLTLCSQLRSKPGTVVYTIAFGKEVNSSDVRQFLSDCASGPHGTHQPNLNQYFFIAPDAEDLETVFDSIIGDLQRVRIVQ